MLKHVPGPRLNSYADSLISTDSRKVTVGVTSFNGYFIIKAIQDDMHVLSNANLGRVIGMLCFNGGFFFGIDNGQNRVGDNGCYTVKDKTLVMYCSYKSSP